MSLNADRPIAEIQDDVLGHRRFAKRLGESIISLKADSGFVIALNGQWGSGKTGIINLVKDYLRGNSHNTLVVEFNPWMFPQEQELYYSYFESLAAHLGTEITGIDTLLSDIYAATEGIGFLKNTLSIGAVAANQSWFWKKVLGKKKAEYLRKASKTSPQSIESVRDKISQAIIDSGKKILVIVDDIDRLEKDEIRALFRLIKSVANFSNVIYLVSFDRRIAREALKIAHEVDGDEYLEKIVQASFEVPPPTEPQLRKILFAKLNEITDDYKLPDETRWWNVYYEGVRLFLDTPRDVVRLSNALALSWPPVSKDLDLTDFVFIEGLRVFKPKLYHLIRSNLHRLTGYSNNNSQRDKAFYDELRTEAQGGDIFAKLEEGLMRVFPRLEGIWSNMGYTADSYSSWKHQRRICSEDDFLAYFKLGIEDESISQTEIRDFIKNSHDPIWVEKKLREFSQLKRENGITKVAEYLERIQYAMEDIPIESCKGITLALLSCGDELILLEDKEGGFYTETNEIRISRILYHLLAKCTEEERAHILLNAFENSSSLSLLISKLSMLENSKKQERGYDKDKIPEAIKNKLKKIVLKKISIYTKSRKVLTLPNLPFVLYKWSEWEGKDKVTAWAKSITTQTDYVAVMKAFTKETTSHLLSDRVTTTYPSVSKKDVDEFFDLKLLIEKAEIIISKPKASQISKEIASKFLEGLKNNDRR